MKRKILASALIIACLSILAIGGTLAYYSTSNTAHNLITTGGIDIKLIETGADGNPFPADGITGVMPGQKVTKEVTVQNVGPNDAYLRLKVTGSVIGSNQQPLEYKYISCDFNTENWEERDGYYYYLKPLAPNQTTEALFSKVSFDPQMGNEYQNATVNITVEAQAVQARNNGTDVFTAAGWASTAAPAPNPPTNPDPTTDENN